jgi:hypothetical protein
VRLPVPLDAGPPHPQRGLRLARYPMTFDTQPGLNGKQQPQED